VLEEIGDKMRKSQKNKKGKLEEMSDSNIHDLEVVQKKQNSYVEINRDEEDADVVEFQKTGDMDLLTKIYNNRIPTLHYWVKMGHNLSNDNEDLFGELTLRLLKSVYSYDQNRGSFNTLIMNSFLNYLRNLSNSKKAKKRMPIGLDPKHIGHFVLSLDWNYKRGDGENELTLKDIVSNKIVTHNQAPHRMSLGETIDLLSNNDNRIKNFLYKMVEGNTLSSILKDYRTKYGKIVVSRSQAHKLNRDNQKRYATRLIKDQKGITERFNLLEYRMKLNKMEYKIELKKSEDADFIMKTIRRFRKNKDHLLAKIN
jgi:hypothetical protein